MARRVDAIESELRQLTGAVEELQFRVETIVEDGTRRIGDLGLDSLGIIYLTMHQAAMVSISRVTGVANANAPRCADAPIPDAMMLRAAFRSA